MAFRGADLLSRFLRDRRGTTVIEYGLLIAVFSVVILTLSEFFGQESARVNASVIDALKTSKAK